MDESVATHLLKIGEYGILSMTNNQEVYGLPVSYAWDGNSAIYFHCAFEGRKVEFLKANNKVSFSVVGRTNIISDKFTTEFESIILDCEAHNSLSQEEKHNALKLILEKYSPNDMESGLEYIDRAIHKTEIFRLDIIKWSGKTKGFNKI
jgi:nitroimidazol reductase NimA-like FMN-containing flavoprotein (pyridoxamine 5'-phosphate oxidase superfamily)